jgi:hypothetical protein
MTQEIRQGPIRHESLPPDLLEKIRIVPHAAKHPSIRRWLCESLLRLTLGFRFQVGTMVACTPPHFFEIKD